MTMALNLLDDTSNRTTAVSTENLILSTRKQPTAGRRESIGTQSERQAVNFCVKQREYRIHS